MRLDDFERPHHVLQYCAPRQQRGILKSHSDDIQRPDHRFAANIDLPDRRGPEAGHDFHQRGFSAAGRSDDRYEFSLLDFKAGAVESERRFLVVVTERNVLKSNKTWHRLSPTTQHRWRDRFPAMQVAGRCGRSFYFFSMLFRIIACTPLTLFTVCVTCRSPAKLHIA